MRPTEQQNCEPRLDHLCTILSACGFNARLWKGFRIYLSGYGRDIKAYLQTDAAPGPLPADGFRLVVTSSWNAPRYNGLRCKGVKHAILEDLFAARLISAPPPLRWQDVELDAPQATRRPIRPYLPASPQPPEETPLPARQSRDPYAALRALHRDSGNA